MAANAGGVALAVVPPRRRSRLDCVDDWSQDGDASAQLAADVAGGRATALQGEVVKCRLSVRDEALIGRVERPPQPSEQDAAQREQPLAGHEDDEREEHDDEEDEEVCSEDAGEPDGEAEAGVVNQVVWAAPEKGRREHLREWDRVARLSLDLDVGTLLAKAVDGQFCRLSLAGFAWCRSSRKPLATEQGDIGYRTAGALMFAEGDLQDKRYTLDREEDIDIGLPREWHPKHGKVCFLSLCCAGVGDQSLIHAFRVVGMEDGRLRVVRTHAWGRTQKGKVYEVKKATEQLRLPMFGLRFASGDAGEAPALRFGARGPKQRAAQEDVRSRLSYLLAAPRAAPQSSGPASPFDAAAASLEGFQGLRFTRVGRLVALHGVVLLGPQHRENPFAALPPGCRPERHLRLLVARGPASGRLEPELLEVSPSGELRCPQLPRDEEEEEEEQEEEGGAEGEGGHEPATSPGVRVFVVHLCGAVFAAAPALTDAAPIPTNAGLQLPLAGDRLQRRFETFVTSMDRQTRKFRDRIKTPKQLAKFEEILARFIWHDCDESSRLTHSSFKGRQSDFTNKGMQAFDSEEDLQWLCGAIAWLYRRGIPVVLMERQTAPVYPMIWDLDLKCKNGATKERVPLKLKTSKPWRGDIAFCSWGGGNRFILGHDHLILRHIGKVIFEFFDLPHLDLCVFSASGWDRVKQLVKVSLHVVAPGVFVTAKRLQAIRGKIVEHLEACSAEDGPLRDLYKECLEEDDDNTWDAIVDKTTTRDGNGLRMPYCDKAQEVLRPRMAGEQERRRRDGEPLLTEREIREQRGSCKEESGRPCLPLGTLRLEPQEWRSDDTQLPRAFWTDRPEDLPIEEWMHRGRCRCPLGTRLTPWRPPVQHQWCEGATAAAASATPDAAASAAPEAQPEAPAVLAPSPFVRRFAGSAGDFRARWDAELSRQTALWGRWVRAARGARWRGGLRDDDRSELIFVPAVGAGGGALEGESALGGGESGRILILTAPRRSAGEVALSSDVFAALRRALAAWTAPDDVLCRSPQSVVPLRAPSPDFRTVQEAVDTAIEDGAMTRIVVEAGEHDLQGTLVIRSPVLLEGAGEWKSTLRSRGCAVLRFEGAGLASTVQNLRLQVVADCDASDAYDLNRAAIDACVEAAGEGPDIVGCDIEVGWRWGACVRSTAPSVRLLRNHFSGATWGAVLLRAGARSRVEGNHFDRLGEAGLVLLGGAAVVRGNTFEACGGAGVHIVGQCMAALERNKIRECLVGLHIGDASASLRLDGNMFKNNGNSDDCATDLPPGYRLSEPPGQVWVGERPVPLRDEDLRSALLRAAEPRQLDLHIRCARLRARSTAKAARDALGTAAAAEALRRAAEASEWWRLAVEAHQRLVSLCLVRCSACGDALVREEERAAQAASDVTCTNAAACRSLERSTRARFRCSQGCSCWCGACFAEKSKSVIRPAAAPVDAEVGVAVEEWDGPGEGYGEGAARLKAGDLVAVDRTSSDEHGWLKLRGSSRAAAWCGQIYVQ